MKQIIGKDVVAIQVNHFKLVEGKITLPGATKDAVKALPAFEYAKQEGRIAAVWAAFQRRTD